MAKLRSVYGTSVKRLTYFVPANNPYTIDLARDLSVVCRKLHRQKMTYTVLGGIVKESSGGVFAFKTAPHTWTTNVAIRRAFNMWRKANAEQYKKTPGLKAPKWSDFKLYLDRFHRNGNNLQAVLDTGEAGGQSIRNYGAGEWNYSTLVQPKLIDPDNDGGLEFDDNADGWDMHIVGEHTGTGEVTTDANGSKFYTDYDTVGVIRSWFDSRSIPHNPDPLNAPTGTTAPAPGINTDPLSNLFDVQDDDAEMIDVIQDENDQAPYAMNQVPGMGDNELQLVAITDNTSGEPDIVSVPGFQAPCGLIRLKPESNNGAILMLDVLVEGERI